MYISKSKSGIVILVIMTQWDFDNLTNGLHEGQKVFGDGINLVEETFVNVVIESTVWKRVVKKSWSRERLTKLIPGFHIMTII